MKKNDIILIAALLALSAASYFGIRLYAAAHTKEAVAVVTVDGEEYGRYPLDEDCTACIELSDESYNVLVISGGYADMTEASCPDKICVSHRKISKTNETIVCLPNRVVVTIENAGDAEIDVFTY